MTHLSFTNDGKEYKQITKRTAKKLFCDGKTIYACPSNMRPFNNPWGGAYDWNYKECVEKEIDYYGKANTFDFLVNACVSYNCNSETGRYLRFYVETGV